MHDLIKNNQIIKSYDFGEETPPELASNKGQWLPRVIIEPAFNPEVQTQELVKTITETESQWQYVVTDKPLADMVASKKNQLAVKALEIETQGVTVGSDDIATDRESIARLTSALSLMGRQPSETTPFQTKNGWSNANKAGLEAVQDAVWAHVKATATNHKAHADAIDLLSSAQAVFDYDISTGW